MSQAVSVGEVMTELPVSIDLGSDVVAAKVLMDEHGIRHLPVTQGGSVVGVITDRDIQVAGAVSSDDASAVLVREVCHRPAFVVERGAPLADTVMEMAERQLTSVVVTDGDKLAGILTQTDVCRLLAERLGR